MAIKNLKLSHGHGYEPGNGELSRIKKADVDSESRVSIRPHKTTEWLMVQRHLEQCPMWLTCYQIKCLLQDSQKDGLGFSDAHFNKQDWDKAERDPGRLGHWGLWIFSAGTGEIGK